MAETQTSLEQRDAITVSVAPAHTTGPSGPRTRVAICATHPIQYHAPLWRALAAMEELQVKVLFGCDMSVRGYRDVGFGSVVKWDVPLTEGYDSEFLSTDPRINRVGFFAPDGRGLELAMRKFAPDVTLVTAYNGAFHLRALRAARKLGSSVVMRHEGTDSAFGRGALKSRTRDIVLRAFYSRVDRFAAIGQNAKRHLLRLGVAEERIGRSPYCVDSTFFEAQRKAWLPKRDGLRAKLGVGADQKVFLFSGKLTPKKDPLLLASALAGLHPSVLERVHVVVVGDGVLRGPLEAALRHRIGNRAHFPGFLNQSEIGSAYAAADVLVLPSKQGAGETWGLVVNEGMQFGLPAIVSDAVGCHPDLVVSDETGWTFPSGDAAALARRIGHFALLGTTERARYSEAAIRHVARYSLEAAADGLAHELMAAAKR